MSGTVWSVPHEPLTPEMVRLRILGQHRRLRELLSKAHATAESALDGHRQTPDAVASAVGDVRAVFEVHLSFEEQVLPVLLDADPAAAPALAERVRAEHRHQRAMLAGLHHEAAVQPELPILAAKLAFLTRSLLEDMDEEEKDLLR